MEALHPAVHIGHVHLRVAEPDRAVAFYRDVLGFEPTAYGPSTTCHASSSYRRSPRPYAGSPTTRRGVAGAVLNACRALRYATDGRWSSKVDAGRWALERVDDHPLIAEAFAARRAGEVALDDDGVAVTGALVGRRLHRPPSSPMSGSGQAAALPANGLLSCVRVGHNEGSNGGRGPRAAGKGT